MNRDALFDDKAEMYDNEFTSSYVGAVQRKVIHDIVQKQLLGKTQLEILELNCGTGADIPFLEQFGKVTATDVSEEMLKMAIRKNPAAKVEILDLNKPLPLEHKYDLIFSNFGGLNCISPSRIKHLNDELSQILNPGGQMFLVFMHRWSLVEFLYFLLKLKFKKAFRRLRGRADFNEIPIYYYSKKETAQLFRSFKLVNTNHIGVLLTGEYMNTIGAKARINENKTRWLNYFLGSDHILFNFIRPL